MKHFTLNTVLYKQNTYFNFIDLSLVQNMTSYTHTSHFKLNYILFFIPIIYIQFTYETAHGFALSSYVPTVLRYGFLRTPLMYDSIEDFIKHQKKHNQSNNIHNIINTF